MNNIMRWIVLVLVSAVALACHGFEYRIVSNVADSLLNGCEVRLSNESNWVTLNHGTIENGLIDIKGESERTFPAILSLRSNDSDNPKYYKINLIVEPATIEVEAGKNVPLSGGELNEGLKNWMERMSKSDNIQESHEICMDLFKRNLGNGLGEFALLYFGQRCAPDEWAEAISLLDDESRVLAAFDKITATKERLASVWEGQPFKDLSGESLNGDSINLSDFLGKGKYVVADLWASWCKPCIILAETHLKPLYEKFKDNPDIQFLGIAMDDVSKVVDSHNIAWPQIMNCKKLMSTYVINAVPEIIIFGPDGKIMRRYVNPADLESIILEVLGE